MRTRLEPKDDRRRRNGRLVAACALLLTALGAGPARATSGDVLDLDGLLRIARGEEKAGEEFTSAPKTVVGRIWHRLFGKGDPEKTLAA